MITATQPEISVINRKRSLEVRWILPGPPGAAVAEWFARFEAAGECREDTQSCAQWLTDGPAVCGR